MSNDIYDDLDELPAPSRKNIPEGDRLLLELAARALGAFRVEEVDGEVYLNLHFADGSVVYGWNSLLFYGDAFELQVRLQMSVEVARLAAIAWFRPAPGVQLIDCTEDTGADPLAATCRAITRAAAQIGKQRS